MPDMDFREKAVLWPKGNYFEDFEPGRVFKHHWGRTINAGDNSLFATTMLQFNPLYFNAEYARGEGHPDVVVCPMLVFATVFGLSVEDLSENGGAFLGIEDLSFHRPVYPGDTLTASSKVVDRRSSSSRPGFGIVSWLTEGIDQHGTRVVDFVRTNLVARKEAAGV